MLYLKLDYITQQMAMRPCQRRLTRGKFAASRRTGEFAGTAYSQPLATMKKKNKKRK